MGATFQDKDALCLIDSPCYKSIISRVRWWVPIKLTATIKLLVQVAQEIETLWVRLAYFIGKGGGILQLLIVQKKRLNVDWYFYQDIAFGECSLTIWSVCVDGSSKIAIIFGFAFVLDVRWSRSKLPRMTLIATHTPHFLKITFIFDEEILMISVRINTVFIWHQDYQWRYLESILY